MCYQFQRGGLSKIPRETAQRRAFAGTLTSNSVMASDFDTTSDRPKLPALRAEVLGATSVKTPRLYLVLKSNRLKTGLNGGICG